MPDDFHFSLNFEALEVACEISYENDFIVDLKIENYSDSILRNNCNYKAVVISVLTLVTVL